MMLMIGDPCVRVEPALMEPSRERSTVVAHLQSGGCVRAAGHGSPAQRGRVARRGLAQTERGWVK